MATDSHTATAPDENGQDRFDALMVRLVFLVSRLKLAAEDLSAILATEEHSSAALVVQEAAEDLAQLYEAFGTFDGEYDPTPRGDPKSRLSARNMDHEHTPKEVQS